MRRGTEERTELSRRCDDDEVTKTITTRPLTRIQLKGRMRDEKMNYKNGGRNKVKQ